MPVTARLSKAFYEKLGEDVANELVDWFNQVDATYRSDLRELNETNFVRFDARLEQRVAELASEFGRLRADLDRMETRLEARLDARLEARLAESDARLERRLGDLRFDLIRWMLVFWVASTGTVAGLLLAL